MVTGVLDIRRNDDADELLHDLDAVGPEAARRVVH
jgi:hypothetical protein